jgi:hypothetical protein
MEAESHTELLPEVGDLEPSLELLELLLSQDAVKEDINLILEKDPLVSLFDFEFGNFKPVPPPSKSAKSKPPKRKRGRPPKDKREQENLDSSGAQVLREGKDLPADESEAADEQPKGSRSQGKQGTFTLPGQTQVPPMVEDVDNQGSFKMFNAGWILPPDQKRGGRGPVDRSPLPKKNSTSRLVILWL